MPEEKIKEIFKKKGIDVQTIKNASNSYNSKVFIVEDEKDKYILKISRNPEKRMNECRYYNYLYDYVPTSKVIFSDCIDGEEVNIITFFEGKNLYDEECNTLSREEIFKIGELLAKIHSCKTIDEENDSWITYLYNRLDKCGDELLKILGADDKKILDDFQKSYIQENIEGKYTNSILHMDFRIGNIMLAEDGKVGIIDLESMKNGDYVFDFVKMNRIFSKKNFQIFLEGYVHIHPLENNFYARLEFYSLYDSYSSLYWCVINNQTDSEFYKLNYSIVMKYLEKIKTGQWRI